MIRDIAAKALALIKRCDICVIGSIDNDGCPAMRAMLNRRENEVMRQLYFSTNTSSRDVAEYGGNPEASVYFFDPDLFQGLLLRGRMQVTTDQRLRDRLWRDGDNVYYQLGPSDPDYCVMLFTASNGRWYEDLRTVDLTGDDL